MQAKAQELKQEQSLQVDGTVWQLDGSGGRGVAGFHARSFLPKVGKAGVLMKGEIFYSPRLAEILPLL